MPPDATHEDYLTRLENGGGDEPVSRLLINSARSWWARICDVTKSRMPIPASYTTPDCMFYGWDNGQQLLEIEIYDSGWAEFFYYDRAREECLPSVEHLSQSLSDEIVEKMAVFVTGK